MQFAWRLNNIWCFGSRAVLIFQILQATVQRYPFFCFPNSIAKCSITVHLDCKVHNDMVDPLYCTHVQWYTKWCNTVQYKLDAGASLAADPLRWNSTIRQNPPIWALPFFLWLNFLINKGIFKGFHWQVLTNGQILSNYNPYPLRSVEAYK